MYLALVGGLAFVIGISLGLSGLGGFLVVPVLVGLAGLGPRAAVFHALASFVLPGALASYLYARYRNLSWSLALLLSAGTLPGALIGRLISVAASRFELQVGMGVALMAVSVVILVRRQRGRPVSIGAGPMAAIVVALGFSSGVLSVLTGIGGPLVAVPVLMALGFEMTALVGAAILNSVVVSVASAAALVRLVSVVPIILAVLVVAQTAGVLVGFWLQPRVSDRLLRPLVACGAALAGMGFILWSLT